MMEIRHTAWDELPLVMTVEEMAKVLNIGRQAAYDLVHRQGFPTVRIGRKLRVTRDGLHRWLETNGAA